MRASSLFNRFPGATERVLFALRRVVQLIADLGKIVMTAHVMPVHTADNAVGEHRHIAAEDP